LIPIVKSAVDFGWFLLKYSLVAGLIGGALALPQLFRRVDEVVRRRIEAKLAQHYAGLKVTVHAAELVEGKGIAVRGLKIVAPELEKPYSELLYVEEMYLSCRTELEELLKGEPEVDWVVLRRPTLRSSLLADGTWSTAALLPLPASTGRSPAVEIDGGTIELCTPGGTLALRELNVAIAGSEQTADPGANPRMRSFRGTFTGDLLRGAEIEGQVDPHQPRWTIRGSVASVAISPELRDALPPEWAAPLAHLRSLRGDARLDFQARYDPDEETPLDFAVSARLAQGRLDDPRLPHSLSDVEATVDLDREGIRVKRFSARCDQATLELSGRVSGYGECSPRVLEGEIKQLKLDDSLVDILPDALRRHWFHYLPSGQINADFKLDYDGRRWKPELTVRCQDASFTYHKFPYRLEHARGTLELKDDVLTANLTGYSGSQSIRLVAEIQNPLGAPCGWVTAKGERLPLDEKLLGAVPEKAQAVIRSLEPRGTIDFSAKVWRDRAEEPWHRWLAAELNDCAMRYKQFPYPISNIRGTLEMLDDHWTAHQLAGANDAGAIACRGDLDSLAEGSQLHLWLGGSNVRFEEELRNALPPAMRQVWDDFRPQGTFDLGDAEILYEPASRRLNVAFKAEPRSETASIQPVRFPYRLDRLQGVLEYRDGQATLKGFRGKHDNVEVATSGQGDFLPDGSWRFRFDNLAVDRVRFDRELVQALPALLKRAVAELNPGGPIYLRGGQGALALGRGGNPGDPLTSQWNLEIGFQQLDLDLGLRLDGLSGALRLVGEHDGERFRSRGELDVDSVSYKDLQFTQVRGPVWIDDQRVLFGAWDHAPPFGRAAAPGPAGQQPASLSAKLFGGTVFCDAKIALGPSPRYVIYASLQDADLARCAQDLIPGRQNLQGKMWSEVSLQGEGRSASSLVGRGSVALRDADIYEIPLMIALLKILSIRRPDKSAFCSSDIDFHVEHGRLYFDRLNFNGDAISLVGTRGEMDFQGNVNLVFHSVVGRSDRSVPILGEILGGASQQIMQIRVTGTLQNPETRREPLPAVNQAIQQLRAERERNGLAPLGILPEGAGQGLLGRRLPKKP